MLPMFGRSAHDEVRDPDYVESVPFASVLKDGVDSSVAGTHQKGLSWVSLAQFESAWA